MRKKLLSMLLALCMVLTLLPMAAFAADETSVGTIEALRSAINASATPLVKLTANIDGELVIPAGKTSITIDLNGKTFTNSDGKNYWWTIKFWETGILTIKDSAGGGSLTFSMGSAISSQGGGRVVIEGGTVRGIVNTDNGTVTVNGGMVTAFESYYNAIENTTTNTTCTINGGTVTGSCSSAATTQITGGSINATFSGIGTITNGTGADVTMYTLTLNGAANKAVTGISFSPAYAYGMKDVQTDSNGKLYVWLPASQSAATVTATTADGSSYSGTISGNAATLAPTLTGTVTISGTMKFNQQLTATVTDTNNTGLLTYQWKRGSTNIGTGATYTTVTADVGQTLTCVVTSSTETGSITSAPTATIAKADGPYAPSVTFSFDDANANKLWGATTAMHYSLDGGTTYNPCTANMALTVDSISAENDIRVRVAETGDTLAGAALTIDILPGAAIPAGTITTTGCTSDSNNDGLLKGVTAAMEYQKSGTSTWTSGGSTVNGLSYGDYLVRNKATGQIMAGTATTVSVAEFIPTVVNNLALNGDVTAPIKGAVPTTEINNGQYTGTVSWNGSPTKFLGGTAYTATVTLTAKQNYTFTGVGTFTHTGATSVTPSENNGSALKITIVFPATQPRELASIAVTKQPNLVYKFGETFNADGMEVTATYDDGTTKVVTGTTNLNSALNMEDHGKVVTVSYTEGSITKIADTNAITVNKADGPSAPSITFSFEGDNANKLMGATADMEYRLDGGSDDSGWQSCSADLDLTNSLTSITDTNDIKVRVKATDTHEAGTVNTLNITKAAIPTSPAATDADVSGKGTLTGLTTAMEYQKSDATGWTTGTGSSLSLDPGTYYVRVKATGTVLASDNQPLTIGVFVKDTPTAADLSYDLSPLTYDDAPKFVTVTKNTVGIGDLTVKYNGSTTPPTNVGTYAITVDITATAEYESVTDLCLGDFVINKAEYSGNKTATATVRANRAENNLTVNLPSLPDGASYAASGTIGGTNSALIASHSIGGTTLTFSTASQAVTSATITIPVTGATNYNNYSVVVTITAVDKEIVTIDGLTAVTHLVYNGTAQKGYSGTVAVSDNKVPTNELLYTYTSTDGSGYTATTAPTNAGTYKLVVSVADTNVDYTGVHADITFTINKANITVTAKDKSAYVGGTAPVFAADDYTVTGLVGGETLKTVPSLAYASTPDMTKTGTEVINISGAVAPEGGNYNAIIHKEGVLTISNRPSSGGGGSYTPPAPVTKIDNGGSTTGANLERLVSAEKPLTVDDKSGAKLVFSTDALKGIGTQTSSDIKVEMKDVSPAHQENLPGNQVFSLAVTSDNKAISNFGGAVTVSLPYELKSGETADKVAVWYLASDGTMTKIPCTYDTKTGLATFTVTHFSLYVVGVDKPWVNPFTDVSKNDWFYGAVEFANRNSLFAGTGADSFSPGSAMTRAMLWTVLGRLDGQNLSGKDVFDTARSWAMSTGITDGTNPDGSITREQMVTILWRYSGSPKANGDLSKFSDAGSVASYAADAMAWAVENGIMAGTNGALTPQDNATRAQVATILQSFIEAMPK